MFKKLRRNGKQIVEQRRSSVAAAPTNSEVKTLSERSLTFFDLPAEIRNVIYEDVARNMRIFVPLSMKKSGKMPLAIPSLLLVSRQTRHEYLPLLLEFAAIAIVVKDFDFKNLMRITSSLYRTELKALRNNARLTLQLLIERCSKESIAALRRWLVNRTEGLDRLHWHYSIAWPRHTQIVPTSTQVHRSNTFAWRRRLLNQNLEAMSQLHHNVEETLQFELQPVIAVFEREVDDVGADPDLPWREESALMMVSLS